MPVIPNAALNARTKPTGISTDCQRKNRSDILDREQSDRTDPKSNNEGCEKVSHVLHSSLFTLHSLSSILVPNPHPPLPASRD
jgi:hypothetical protein